MKNHLRKVNENIKILLTIIIILLFFGNYYICEYFYSDNTDAWWDLKLNLYAVIIALLLFLSRIGSKGILAFFLDVGIGLSLSNVIDRVYRDTTTFTEDDIYMIIATIIGAVLTYKKQDTPDAFTKTRNTKRATT